MGWPQSQDYNEAIQNPRTCFKDAELSKGQAATNSLGMPLPCSGNFADVYQVHCPETKTRWAVKCFTRGDPNSLRQRYAEVDRHLQQAKLPFTVGFRFLDEGIRVRNQWHPVLKMQWVGGMTLNHFVRDHLDKPKMLDALLQIWARMAKRLREADLAHADLQHGNVLLVRDAAANALNVKLIDYDGMWVPALAGQRSGEVGHPAYQHSRRLRDGTYSQEVDRFPLLVVAAALRSLRVAGRPLWERFDNGDNLLFRETDLAAPEQSPLFAELVRIQDAQAQQLVDSLLKACRQPLERTPFLNALLLDAAPVAKPVPNDEKRAPAPLPISAGTPPSASLSWLATAESLAPQADPVLVPDPPAVTSPGYGAEPLEPSGPDGGSASSPRIGAIAFGIVAVLMTTALVFVLRKPGKTPDLQKPRTGNGTASQSLPVPPNAKPVMDLEFKDGNRGLYDAPFDRLTGKPLVEGEYAVRRILPGDRFFLVHPSFQGGIEDFVWEAECRLDQSLPGSWGIRFGIRPDQSHLDFHIRWNGAIRLVRFDKQKGGERDAIAWTDVLRLGAMSEWNTFRLEVASKTIRIFVNGQPVATCREEGYTGSRLEVFLLCGEVPFHVRFRRVRVWELPRTH